MQVIRKREPGGERVLALGTFDGVHRGHRRLLETGKQYAREYGISFRVCSFDVHPLQVLRPEKAPWLLTTLPEKAALMRRSGADELQLLAFTGKIAGMEPEAYLRMLRESVRVRAVTAGWNYTFGLGGRGDADMLREDGRKHGYDVLIVPPEKTEEGQIISSTLIRKLLDEGKTGEAEALLGHPYFLRGKAEEGRGTAPAAGIRAVYVQIAGRKQLPAPGIYPCFAESGKESGRGILKIGPQPAASSAEMAVEALFPEGKQGFSGGTLRMRIGNRIRAELNGCETPEELAKLFVTDMETAEKWTGWS